ncbi:hypothetical protein GOBAR_AA27842 [Gossypium barbadense]|uniref:DUF4283 domain-containing protein n=1 Tax=Gossypium barbadense TaxID=3634 RepID=A0A2P5WP10_GOSBA|nr:hypothetical protein GOBAR_AA27842 [Gossypium barbadense]
MLVFTVVQFMEDELANLSISDEEEEALQEKTAHPTGGICITDLGNKCYIFQLFNEVDVQRVIVGTPWFFNSHLLLLHRIQKGENLSVLLLNFSEFWVQIHELPTGLMSESIARQFGDFLGKFLDYDTSISFSGNKTYMRIRVRLDVTAPLKRKNKIQRSTVVSRWLREADGSQCQVENMGSPNHSNSINWEMNSSRNFGRDFGDKMSNPNLIPLGSNQQYSINGNNNGSSLGKSISFVDRLENGPIKMVVEEENDSLTAVKGKKWQRLVISPNDPLGFNVEYGTIDLMASSGGQSSRSQ